MADVVKLKQVIDASGLRKGFIVEKLGITRQGFYKKETGQSDFTASEVAIMKELLRLSDRETSAIFLHKE